MYHQLSRTPQICNMISLSRRLRKPMPQHLSRPDRHMSYRSHCRHRMCGENHPHSTRNTICCRKHFQQQAIRSRRSWRLGLQIQDNQQPKPNRSGGTPPIRRLSPHNNVSVWSRKVKAQRSRQVEIWNWPLYGTFLLWKCCFAVSLRMVRTDVCVA